MSRELEKHGARGFLAAKVTGSSASAISILKSSRQRELYHCFETGGFELGAVSTGRRGAAAEAGASRRDRKREFDRGRCVSLGLMSADRLRDTV